MRRLRQPRCQFRKCPRLARYAVELEGRRYWLCDRHYRNLLKLLKEAALEAGSSSLGEIRVRVRGGRITRFERIKKEE